METKNRMAATASPTAKDTSSACRQMWASMANDQTKMVRPARAASSPGCALLPADSGIDSRVSSPPLANSAARVCGQRCERWHTHSTMAVEIAGSEMPKSRSEEHTSELQSRGHLVCRLLLEKQKS